MNLLIKNCNNIDLANIEINEYQLNIKYGINGTGKSTISKAIKYCIENKEKLIELKPFKYSNGGEEVTTIVEGLEGVNTVNIFNEAYVNQYVFQEDEVLKNSYDVFIKNEEYDSLMSEIENLIKEVRDTFNKNTELDKLIQDLNTLTECFGKSSNGYSAAGSIGKGLKNGNKIIHIPDGLEEYGDYIKSDLNSKWLKWQVTGKEYLDISCKCPFCTTDITSNKEKVLKVSEEYDSKHIEHLNKVMNVFDNLKLYFTDETNKKIREITQSISGLSREHINYLKLIKSQVNTLLERFSELKNLSFFSLKDVDEIIEEIKRYRIDLYFLPNLNTDFTEEKIEKINNSLNDLINKAGILKGKINKQKSLILKRIEKYKKEINNFLKYAGYKYEVNIESKKNEYKMVFQHKDCSKELNSANLYLSYGEKNAFALILFMYETLSKKPDLVILDDLISSFDKNKKYAIINKLFKGENSFRNNTVLMLTHDFDPIVDMVKNFKNKFNEIKTNAYFISNKNGEIIEKEICYYDIKTFVEIAKDNILRLDNNINKLIYLRRLYEINDFKGLEWNLLSNLFHKRKEPIINNEINGIKKDVLMDDDEIEEATYKIKEFIDDFNYDTELDRLLSNDILMNAYINSKNNYEKLQIFRVIKNENSSNDIIKKFVNETYHVDNDYLFQLNPFDYEIIPDYIIEECNNDLINSGYNIEKKLFI
ncbi:hypothetical protein [Clostridium chrysemydis]|uniref:hypothetical protein n=1 Tax=Clostridium chrysemydis TaxID=2665504 RepID=UPI001883B569|nr:hypothetical protein [Clostridium chrysemydis]